MKVLLVTTMLLVSASAFAQGTIRFNNRITGVVDAPIRFPWGAGLGSVPDSHAQLYLVTGGTTYTPLTPATTFRNTSEAATPYVVEPNEPVIVPGVQPGQTATLVMRAWVGGSSYEAAL